MGEWRLKSLAHFAAAYVVYSAVIVGIGWCFQEAPTILRVFVFLNCLGPGHLLGAWLIMRGMELRRTE